MERLQGAGTRFDRYAIFEEIASGGMASVHLGRLVGPAGFSRTVAIKRMHPHLAKQEEFVTMFLDEALLATRIHHPNVVAVLDVVSAPAELALVMEFVQGESLDRLMRVMRNRGERVMPHVAATVASSVLHGLHAAHSATNEHGEPLGIVHRDVSPQNVLVGLDGVIRVADFGIAKARGRLQTTREGQVKGKITYMAPEQALHEEVDCRCDVFAVGIILWEMLVGRRLFDGVHEAAIISKLLCDPIPPPSTFHHDLRPFDPVVLKALAQNRDHRYPTARALAVDLERLISLATPTELGGWVERLAGDTIARRVELVRAVERIPFEALPSSTPPPALDGHEALASGAALRAPRVPIIGTPATGALHTPASDAATRVEGVRGNGSGVSSISVARSTSAAPAPSGGGAMWAVWIAGAICSAIVGGGIAAFLLRAPPQAKDGAFGQATKVAAESPAANADRAAPPVADEPPAPAASSLPDAVPTLGDRPRSGRARPSAGPARPHPASASAGATAAPPTGSAQKPTDYGF